MAAYRLCLDTSLLIGYLREREPEASLVEFHIQQSDCCVTAMTVYELLFGAERSGRKDGSERERALLDALTVLPFDDGCARRAAKLHAQLIRQNADVGIKDVLIAATCLETRIPLLTANARHFRRVPGLELVDPADLRE
jgi:tRNA(fMet)-specific endonuclease VapC